ncbi:MAG TPA: fibronectin type III domain-containing protein [Pyrinomonadaceae bacterium]|nr:fibronectin type III domain-containing protein [Pyrinomonadaceae bacterium]
MKFLMSMLMVALFWFGASYARACGVDGVAGKTDTSITISWDVSKCKKLEKFEICWKKAANSGNVCNSPTMQSEEPTGSYTIDGLSPETPYKVKTHWHRKVRWYEITTRIITTDPSPPPTTTTTVLRYEKETPQRYSVTFYWKNPPTPSQFREWKLGLVYQTRQPFGWSGPTAVDLTKALILPQTGEHYWKVKDTFSNNRRYVAWIVKWSKRIEKSRTVDHFEYISNKVEWK